MEKTQLYIHKWKKKNQKYKIHTQIDLFPAIPTANKKLIKVNSVVLSNSTMNNQIKFSKQIITVTSNQTLIKREYNI